MCAYAPSADEYEKMYFTPNWIKKLPKSKDIM